MAPPQGQMRPGRQLAVLAGLFVVLYLFVLFLGTGGMSMADRFQPRLGLDLVGGTLVRLKAVSPDGKPPSSQSMETARQIIESRVNGLGVTEAEVVTEGNINIVVSLAGKGDDRLKDVGEAAELRFRKVLKRVPDQPEAAEPSPSPSATGTPKPTTSASAKPNATATPKPTATATAPPSPTTTASPNATALSNEQRLEAVKKKVGNAAWAAASALNAPLPQPDPRLAPFGKLSSQEVAVLPAKIQFNVPGVSCEKLDLRPAASIREEKQRVVACQQGMKFLLDVAKVVGRDIEGAEAGLDDQQQWGVNLDFGSDGAKKWEGLTREAFNNTGQTEEDKCAEDTLGDDRHCLVAVVLDNKIISAPEIQAVLSTRSTITGDFSNAEATELASQLRYGALPLTFEPQQAQTITAKLGTDHLRAGLLAAGIGMLLVVIYSFFYYRLLGTVIFLSLALSGLLVFGALVVLGRQIGFTLTLAGIAGFIVSLGVAADSFVIYFERLKDEIRDGRSPRSAVPRAWARARRTIISANAISVLAAVVLYLVSVGTVQGFAFALGLSTVLDLVVVFLFRHPIMAMFARTRAFLSPRVSGLGRVLQRDDDDEPPGRTRSPRVKEA